MKRAAQASDLPQICATFAVGTVGLAIRRRAAEVATANPLLTSLTRRERDIVQHVGAGLRNKQIAHELKLSEYTVAAYIKQICYKLQVRNRTAIVTRCMQLQHQAGECRNQSHGQEELQRVMEVVFKPTAF